MYFFSTRQGEYAPHRVFFSFRHVEEGSPLLDVFLFLLMCRGGYAPPRRFSCITLCTMISKKSGPDPVVTG